MINQIILKNAIKCKHCGDVIESISLHDFVTCSCGKVSIDGGHCYLKRCCESLEDYEDLSIVENEDETMGAKR